MDIYLAPDIERLLRRKIAEGLYDSLNEAINATLNIALNSAGLVSQEQLSSLNEDIQEGILAADAGRMSDAYEFLNELRAKYE